MDLTARFEALFHKLSQTLDHENQERALMGGQTFSRVEIRIVGQTALLLADHTPPIAGMINFHAKICGEPWVRKKLADLLRLQGIRLVTDGQSIGVPKETSATPWFSEPLLKVFIEQEATFLTSKAKLRINPTTEKVLERLAYENLLLVSGLEPRRRRITLEEALEAAKEESHILTVLPAILLHNPRILRGIQRDLKKRPALEKEICGKISEEGRKAAEIYRIYLQHKQKNHRTRLFNLRLNEEDWERLQSLSQSLGTFNHSETIRHLLTEATRHP